MSHQGNGGNTPETPKKKRLIDGMESADWDKAMSEAEQIEANRLSRLKERLKEQPKDGLKNTY